MSDVTLGQLCDESAQRDAIHIAIAPVIADELLRAGQHVGLVDGNRVSTNASPIGIIDPFLTVPVEKDQRCFLFLYPHTVTGMRHHWQHPAFPERDAPAEPKPLPDKAQSESWIREFASDLGQEYADLMLAARKFAVYGECSYDNTERYKELWGGFPEFWKHFEIVTGMTVEESDKKSSPYTCSC